MTMFSGRLPELTTEDLQQKLRLQNEEAQAEYFAELLARGPEIEYPVPTSAEVIALDEFRDRETRHRTIGETAVLFAVGD